MKLRFLVGHAFRFPVFGISRRPFQLRRLCLSWFTGQKKHIQRTNTNVKMGKKIWRIEGVGRGGFFFARFFRTIYYVWNKKEEEERRTAVIKTVAIHWMVFTIGETHEDERERKFLVAEEAPLLSFFLFFARQCYVSSRNSCVSSEMLAHRFPRRESTEFTWLLKKI